MQLKQRKIQDIKNATKFYKKRRMMLVAFQNGILPLPKQYPSGAQSWEKDGMNLSKFLRERR